MEIMSVEYAGQTFEFDPHAGNSWKVMRGVTSGDGKRTFDSLDVLFLGRADEYAERLGDELDAMVALANACFEACGAKNS